MITALVVDGFPGRTAEAEVVRWHVAEGDEVDFGDRLCDLEGRTVRLLDRDYAGAGRLRRLRLRLDGRREVQVRPAKSPVRFSVISAEAGVVRRIECPVGGRSEAGTRLALMATTADEPVGPVTESEPASFRFEVVVDESGGVAHESSDTRRAE